MTSRTLESISKRIMKPLVTVKKKLHTTISQDKGNYQHSLLNFTISFYFYAFLITVPISLLRATDTGWQTINYFHVACLVIIFCMQILKTKLAYRVKSTGLILLFYTVGVVADYNLGMSSGNYLYFGICVLLSATFLRLTNTFLILAIIILTQLLFMTLTYFDIISFKISPLLQVNNVHFWSTHITAFVTIISSPLIAIGWLNTSLKSSEDSLKESNKELKSAQQALLKLSQTDELTALPNRRALFLYADTEFKKFKRQKSSFAVLMLDIDHFKSVNDTYGHDAGDIVLKSVATVLTSQVRDYEIVARSGGEEFVIILQEPEIYKSNQVAERIRLAIEKSEVNYQQTTLKVTVSIGLVQADESYISFESLLKRADTNLYKAKEKGRNLVVA